jgi:protein transport protein SEC31
MFGASGLAPEQQRRYDIQWSPMKRGVMATCSLDRKVQVHSVIGLATKSGRPPKWMKPSSGVSCGYGGTVVSCRNTDKIVRVAKIEEQPELVKASNAFEAEIESSNIAEFFERKVATSQSTREQQTWGFMKVMFDGNARQMLVKHLGLDAEKIAQEAMVTTGDTPNGESAAGQKIGMSKAAETTVKRALLVGNYEAAVECCFRAGNLADALLLASCAGPEVWAKTQQRYYESEAPKRPFLSLVCAVTRNQLDDLVGSSDAAKWQETLALISTYAQAEEFPTLCLVLGDKLSGAGDYHAANLCYMCSLSLDHSVPYWLSQLQAANEVRHCSFGDRWDSGVLVRRCLSYVDRRLLQKKGSLDLLALHEFVVKVTVFMRASGSRSELSPEIADLFTKYAGALADQGLLVSAAKYCR